MLLALGASLALLACGDDFGTSCSLPDSEEVEAACEGSGPDASASCVVENIIQCDSRICAVYRGSNGFCTKECETNDDCPGDAFCEEFVVGTKRKYCVLSKLEGR